MCRAQTKIIVCLKYLSSISPAKAKEKKDSERGAQAGIIQSFLLTDLRTELCLHQQMGHVKCETRDTRLYV